MINLGEDGLRESVDRPGTVGCTPHLTILAIIFSPTKTPCGDRRGVLYGKRVVVTGLLANFHAIEDRTRRNALVGERHLADRMWLFIGEGEA